MKCFAPVLLLVVLAIGCDDDSTGPTVRPEPTIGADQSADGNGTSVIASADLIQEFVPTFEVMNYVDLRRVRNLTSRDSRISVVIKNERGAIGTSRVLAVSNGQVDEWLRLWFDDNVYLSPGHTHTFEVFVDGSGLALEWSQDPGLYPAGILYAFGMARDDYDLRFTTGYDELPAAP